MDLRKFVAWTWLGLLGGTWLISLLFMVDNYWEVVKSLFIILCVIGIVFGACVLTNWSFKEIEKDLFRRKELKNELEPLNKESV